MKNNIITIILVIVIGIVAYSYLSQPDTSTSYLSADVKTTDSTDAKYIYNILQQMAKVTLDDSLFSSDVFKSLKDNTVSFPPQAPGRLNPFAPVGSDTSISGFQSTTTISF